MTPYEELLRDLYAAFNARDIERVLAALAVDVEWPNGWEGGWLRGREEVQAYWIRQFAAIVPTVEPVAIEMIDNQSMRVTVHQVVRDHAGQLLSDDHVTHTFHFEHQLVRRMDIAKP